MIEFPDLHGFYKWNFEATASDPDLGSKIYVLMGFYESWAGPFVHALEDDLGRAKVLEHNFFWGYLATQTMVFDWMYHSLMCGVYNVVFRELRVVLESLLTAFYIEKTFGDLTLKDKIEKFRDMEQRGETHGKRVFLRSGLSNWDDHYDMYKKLCSYVHLSVTVGGKEVTKILQEGGQSLDFEFSKQEFLKCYDIWMYVAEVAAQLAYELLLFLGVPRSEFDPKFFESLRQNTLVYTDVDLSKLSADEVPF